MTGLLNAFKIEVVVKDKASQTEPTGIVGLEKSGKYYNIVYRFLKQLYFYTFSYPRKGLLTINVFGNKIFNLCFGYCF